MNTNILNASFIEDLNDIENDKNILNSPTKSDVLLKKDDSSLECGLKKLNFESATKSGDVIPASQFTRIKRTLSSSSSRQLDFSNNVIKSTPSTAPSTSNRRPTLSTIKRGNSFSSRLKEVAEEPQKSESTEIKSRSLELAADDHIDGTEDNGRTTKSEGLHTYQKPEDILETPIRKSNDNFETPLIKFQMPTINRGSQMLTTQKSRVSLEKEFRSQKILFTTPLSISRPPNNIIANDSISLPMEDVLASSNKNINPDPPVTSLPQITRKIEKPQTIEINNKIYRIHCKLGSGGSSTVFLAGEMSTNIECAVKVVHLQGDRAVVEGYLNETRLLAKLQGNINVIKLFDYLHLPSQSILYMVMEKGESDLNKILMTHTDLLPLYEMLNYWHQMLQSVDYIHKNGKSYLVIVS